MSPRSVELASVLTDQLCSVPEMDTDCPRPPRTRGFEGQATHLSVADTEAGLVDSLVRSMPNLGLSDVGLRRFTIREFDTGLGRPDVVTVEVDLQRMQSRFECLGPPTRAFEDVHARLLDSLTAGLWETPVEMAKLHRFSRTRTARLVNDLEERGLIATVGSSIRIGLPEELFGVARISTFEAKLSQWRRAAEQAVRHLWFAADSYVALLRPSLPVLNRALVACNMWNLGLVVYDDAQGWTRTCCPSPATQPFNRIAWYLNERIFEVYCRELVPTHHRKPAECVS